MGYPTPSCKADQLICWTGAREGTGAPYCCDRYWHDVAQAKDRQGPLYTTSKDWNGSIWASYSPAGNKYAVTSGCISNCGEGTGFFGLGGGAAKIARDIAGIGSQIALQAGANVFAPGFGGAVVSQLQTYGSSGGKMGLNLSGILGATGQILGGINTSGFGNISQILGAGLQVAGAAVAPTPQLPQVYSPMMPQTLAPSSQVIRQAAPAVAGGLTSLAVGSAALQAAKAILPKVAAALGRRGITLSKAVDVARKLGKFFSSPEAIALYLGITVSELAQLITAQSARKRRRMNPANAHALRRAARRIKSFHRMCQHTDLIKTRSRRSFGGSRCVTCRKSPCRC